MKAHPAPSISSDVTPSHELRDAWAFFSGVRKVTGRLDSGQVDIINRLLFGARHWPICWMAYGLATAWHEAQFSPQPEWGLGKGRAYGLPGKYGQAQYGRGLVQLTWDRNYEWADAALCLNGRLLKNFDLALDAEVAVEILVVGMEAGAFARYRNSPCSLQRFIPPIGAQAGHYIAARRIINGTDRAAKIAADAMQFEQALATGGYAIV